MLAGCSIGLGVQLTCSLALSFASDETSPLELSEQYRNRLRRRSRRLTDAMFESDIPLTGAAELWRIKYFVVYLSAKKQPARHQQLSSSSSSFRPHHRHSRRLQCPTQALSATSQASWDENCRGRLTLRNFYVLHGN